MTLDKIQKGSWALIKGVGGEGHGRQHLLDMGLIPGSKVKLVGYAPMGDPMELLINGYSLTLRLEDAREIEVEPISEESVLLQQKPAKLVANIATHPGLGEGGKYHSKADEKPLPKGTTLSFALIGNQNCGKTTLFNKLTGANQHVGNFPGVTVDRKDGVIKGYPESLVTDLPGIYSLSPYSSEEIVSKDFLLEHRPKALINILDAGNIERNLYLTMQLMELDIPMVLALNMMDEVQGNGGAIRVNVLEHELGLPIVPVSAVKNEGIEELIEHAIHIAKYQEKPSRTDFCSPDDAGGAVHRCLHGIMHLIEDHAVAVGLPVRFAASKIVEGDSSILERLRLTQNEIDAIEHIIVQMEQERGLDRNAAMADMRFAFIRRLCSGTVVKPHESKEYRRSRAVDKVLTGRFTAIPVFVIIMLLVIWLSIDVLGAPLQRILNDAILSLAETCRGWLLGLKVNGAVCSLVSDGIFPGLGAVLSFIPVIIILFFFLSVLEDSGYLARVAYVSDKFLRKIGLGGRSIVPLLTGFGCSVPAVMATRTLPSARDRKLTTLLIPFISCPGKIPLYAFITSTFFPGHGGLVLMALYLGAILLGIVCSLVYKVFHRKDGASPFVMELPNYRFPTPINVVRLLWDKTKDFVQRAMTVILVASIIIWFLQSFNFRFTMVSPEESMLSWIAGLISPVFGPMGLGDWRVVTALISGILAKENVAAIIQVLGAGAILTPLAALSLLAFFLIYSPCIATLAVIREEMGAKWAIWVATFQCVLAWVVAFGVFEIAKLFML